MFIDTLKKYFGRYGEICDCVIMVDKNSSKNLSSFKDKHNILFLLKY